MLPLLLLVLCFTVGCFGISILKQVTRRRPYSFFAVSKWTVQSGTNTLHSLCPTLQIVTSNPDSEIYQIANFLENSSDHKFLKMDKLTNQQALNGRWLTIATTLPFSRIVPFSQMIMLKVGSQVNVTLGDIVQVINTSEKTYDNYIQFTVISEKKQSQNNKAAKQQCFIAGAVVSRGRLTFPLAPDKLGNLTNIATNSSTLRNRIEIEFTSNELVPYTACYSSNPVTLDALEQDTQKLRKALGIAPDSSLSSPMSIKGWIDVTFISNDSATRIVRGNNKNLFILKSIG